MKRLCTKINDAAVHEFSKGELWNNRRQLVRDLSKFDTDESGRLGFEELEGVTRMRDPTPISGEGHVAGRTEGSVASHRRRLVG